jgi:peroxiredoxin
VDLAEQVLAEARAGLAAVESEQSAKKQEAKRTEIRKLIGDQDRPPAPWTADQQKAIAKAEDEAAKGLNNDQRHWRRAVDELEGRQAIRLGRIKDGLAQLRSAGGVEAEELARLEFAAGEQEKALKAIASEVKSHPNEVLPLACRVELLWRADRGEDAREAFQELQRISAEIDLARRPFQRLADAVTSWGLPADWRQPALVADDRGSLPDLDSLGPWRWSPSPAPAWELALGDGKLLSSREYAGRPHVVVFYLGYGCLHCAEQLHKFAPRMEDLRKQGLELVAISSDNVEGLQRSQEDYTGGELPFPLVSNAALDVFQEYRAYDDFEHAPLHGTFLVDSQGNVRWQDISYEPFMDVDFLLREAKRLLEP